MRKNLAVIDTNVLISALIGQTGYPRKIFEELVLTGIIKMCVSIEVYREYQEVLERKKFKRHPGFTEASTALLRKFKGVAFGMNRYLK